MRAALPETLFFPQTQSPQGWKLNYIQLSPTALFLSLIYFPTFCALIMDNHVLLHNGMDVKSLFLTSGFFLAADYQ